MVERNGCAVGTKTFVLQSSVVKQLDSVESTEVNRINKYLSLNVFYDCGGIVFIPNRTKLDIRR
jgi:hypothetical protein